MKLNLFNPVTPMFKGRREDRNTVQQLKQENDYSLTENNKLRISKAIDNLAKEPGENNVKFLIDVAEDLKYGTNIDIGKEPNLDWKSRLHSAVKQSLAISDPITQNKYTPVIDKVFKAKKTLNEDEQAILKSRESILSRLDISQLKDEKNPNIKRVESNLDYFIASSEVPTKQKKYVLNRLDYFLSPEYKINQQLEGKKTKVFAEMINDLVVDTKDSKVPNTKAINQKHHGMCAAISIARKLMSYEYKADYVDNLMSELDDSPTMMVYDKTQLGKGKKVPIQKANIDFNEAEKKGYRIIDASTTNWMNAADMYGASNTPKAYYIPFDRDNYDTFTDNHFVVPMNDENRAKFVYYQTLNKAKEIIGSARKTNIKKEVMSSERRQNYDKNMSYVQKLNDHITSDIKEIAPSISDKEAHTLTGKLLALEVPVSEKIKDIKDGSGKYHFIPNEEDSIKDKKVKEFLSDSLKDKADFDKLDKKASEIRSLLDDSNSVSAKLNPKSTLSGKVARERKLYEAAAAYRTMTVSSLNDNDFKTDRMVQYDIPDEETLLIDNLDKVIKHIDKTSDKVYINHFANSLGVEPKKEDVVEILTELKAGAEHLMTHGLDDFYAALGLGDRKTALSMEVGGLKDAIQANDKEVIRDSANALKINPDDKKKLLNEYSKFEQTLENNPTENEYNTILNKVGYKNQLNTYSELLGIVVNAMKDPMSEYNAALVSGFNEANGIPEGTPIEESKNVLKQIGANFNNFSQNIQLYKDLMDVRDDKGNLVNSAKPNVIILKKMENEGIIASPKELNPLKERFDKIDKLRSQDEFSSRQGKISDPSLYKFSKAEKITLDRTDKSLNKMYSEVNKELAHVTKKIRKPLEEHYRKIGVEKGKYWETDGQSGLFSEQQTKIVQQMTDKKYYTSYDAERTINTIKEGLHSGISSTSVFHNDMGGHAQYIAEISPAGPDNKDVLYHDNSWGASEHENTWVASDGLTHTDYSDKRGGETGYITNDKWRNGNYVDDMLLKAGEVTPEKVVDKRLKKMIGKKDGYKFPGLMDAVIPGNDDQSKNIAAGIHDTVFIPDAAYIDNYVELATKMTQDQIKKAFMINEKAGMAYQKQREEIDNRLKETPFDKGIQTQEDYDKLKDNDPLKVAFEKVALVRSFKDNSNWKEIAKAKTVQEVKALAKERDKTARSYFDYAFGKEDTILLAYALGKTTRKRPFEIINAALDKHHISLSDDDKFKIVSATALYNGAEKKEFDGSLKNSIGFMVNKTLKQFDRVVPDSENAKLAKQEIKDNLTKDLEDSLYINKDDVKNKSTKFKAIANYIDNKYNPETDEDFVNIYRRLQDMTTEEFKQETADVTKKDLAIKDYTGFDMVKSYKAANDEIINTLSNVLFQKELVNDIKLSETEPSYKYNKLFKREKGAIYKNGRTFDDLYRTFYMTLSSADMDRQFNKYKDINYRKFGAFPAYPKIPLMNNAALKKKEEYIENYTYNTLDTIKANKKLLKNYDVHEKLSEIINSIPDNSKASKRQAQAINSLTSTFITDNFEDDSLNHSMESACTLVNLKNASGSDYKEAFKAWDKEFSALKNINPPEIIESEIKTQQRVLKEAFTGVIATDIPERYRAQLKNDVNHWISEELKADKKDNETYSQLNALSEKISKYSYNKKDAGYSKAAFLADLDKNLDGMLMAKDFARKNKAKKEDITNKFSMNLVNVMSSSVPQEHQEDFAKSLIAVSNSADKLSQEEINQSLVNEFAKFSNLKQEELINNKDVNALSKSMLKLNRNNVSAHKYFDSYMKKQQNIADLTEKFVSSNIKPEYQQAVKTTVNEIVKSSTNDKKSKFDAAKAMEAHDKFMDDFKRYHIMNNPIELLKSFTLLCAKDSPVNSPDNKISKLAETELKSKSASIDAALTIGNLAKIQNSLMDAVSTGNASAVAEHFENYDTDFIDKRTHAQLNMGDDLIISYIANKLIAGDDDSTAVMFINKLGLADKLLRAEQINFDVNKAKKVIEKVINIIGVTNNQVNIVQEVTAPLKEDAFDNENDYAGKIDEAKQIIIDKTKKMPRKKNIKQFLSALDDAKNAITKNPDLPKSIVVSEMINAAHRIVGTATNDDLIKTQQELKAYRTMCSFISKLDIPEYSEAHKLREEYYKKFNEVDKYNAEMFSKAAKNNSALIVQTENDDNL